MAGSVIPPPITFVEKAHFLHPRYAPLLLAGLQALRRECRTAGMPPPAELPVCEDALRRVVGVVVEVADPEPVVVIWITAEEAARRLRRSRRRITQMCAAGQLTARKAARGGWVVDEADVEALAAVSVGFRNFDAVAS